MITALPGLTGRYMGRSLHYFEELDSTSTYCKENARQLPDGAVVLAGRQTAGRGSRGRSWSADTGQCLMMSVLCKEIPAHKLPVLPLLVGLAVSTALEQLCGIPFPIKWSNDVLCRGEGDEVPKKVCGILCEGRTSGQESDAVIGIGVNLLQTGEDFSRLGLVYAQSLYLVTGKTFDFAQVAAGICNEMEEIVEKYRKNGFDRELREAYKERLYTLGKPVRLDGEAAGVAVDIDEDGGLLCDVGGRLRKVMSGEVSVRGLYGYV